jgi:hypothetical protein
MPIPTNAIDVPQPVALLMAPARPLPAGPRQADTNRPQTGEATSPRIQALYRAATAQVRGVIGSIATVGPNGASIGAPGISGLAARHGSEARRLATEAIGSRLDVSA